MSNAATPSSSSSFQTFRKFLPDSFRRDHDWQRAIADSGLPDEIQELVHQVVNKSRLYRYEKSGVAAELISHFQEGHQRGQSFSQLAENFGDPAVTACLIRRSKIRNRPMFMKVFKGLGYGAGAMATAYLALLAFFHLGSTNPTIDYLAGLNGEIANFDDSLKAWPIYRPVWTEVGFSEGGDCKFEELFTTGADGTTQLVRPTDESWPDAVAMLARYEELLEAFRKGAALPSLGLELQANSLNYSDDDFAALFPGADKATHQTSVFEGVDENGQRIMKGSLIGILLPHIQSFRKAARAFHVDTRLAMVEGDSDRAVENIETVLGLANQATESQYLVCSLVGFAVSTIGFDILEEVIESDPDFLSETQLARLQSKIESLQIKGWIKYEGERASLKDLIQRSYTDDGNGDGRMTADGVELLHVAGTWITNRRRESNLEGFAESAARSFVAPASVLFCASRKEITDKTDEYMDRFVADAEIPCYVSTGVNLDAELKENKIKYALLGMMLPASQQVKNAAYRTIGRQEGVITALAIHRYFKKYGEWPTEVDQVSPEFVTEFPIDQADGSLVKFKYDDGVLTVYSVGRDQDDDGGVHTGQYGRSHFLFGKSDTDEGDWILWPVNVD